MFLIPLKLYVTVSVLNVIPDLNLKMRNAFIELYNVDYLLKIEISVVDNFDFDIKS